MKMGMLDMLVNREMLQDPEYVYIDWYNNYLSINGIANAYGIGFNEMEKILAEGRILHNKN